MKRGQASIEQLSTYGWSFLAVTAVIGAIVYFSVLDSERFIPLECTMPSGIYCIDYQTDTDGIAVVLENSVGFNIINMTLSINGTGCDVLAAGPVSLLNGEQGTYVFACAPAPGRFQGTLTLNYSSQLTLRNHQKIGVLSARIE